MVTMNRNYLLSMRTTLTFSQCLSSLRKLLPQKGFRMVTEVPFHREFEQHVGLPWPNYTVLVAWNPFLAYQTLLNDWDGGVLIPFNIVVAETGDSTLIAAPNHEFFERGPGKIGSQVLAHYLTQKIQEIFRELSSQEKLATPMRTHEPAKEST